MEQVLASPLKVAPHSLLKSPLSSIKRLRSDIIEMDEPVPAGLDFSIK